MRVYILWIMILNIEFYDLNEKMTKLLILTDKGECSMEVDKKKIKSTLDGIENKCPQLRDDNEAS